MITLPQLRRAAIGLALAATLPLSAHAGLLDDDEARKAILDLRTKVNNLEASVNAKFDTKLDKNAIVDLQSQHDKTMDEIARLRGQIEVLANDLSTLQKSQRDLYADLDKRIGKLEPRKETIDGQTAEVLPSEKKTYDSALEKLKSGDYKVAITAFQDFIRRYPDSAYAPLAQFWLGTAYFAQQDYKNAIAAEETFVANYADNPRASEALLTIGDSYAQLKDKKTAKKTYQQLIAKYPGTDAAQSAKANLAALK